MAIQAVFTNINSRWIEDSGPYADKVISSRIRLARNLRDIHFPGRFSSEHSQEVLQKVTLALRSPAARRVAGELDILTISELTPIQRQILVEKHLVSPQLIEEGDVARAVVLREDEAVSIMVNEEDHLRLQCLFPGLQLRAAWKLANDIDDALEQQLNFAFDQQLGYLTGCPTNVGTGLRASVMMHLPGLVHTQQAVRILAALSQVGLAVRGIYGEGTEALGNLFQISNQVTLGRTEEEIIDNLELATRQLIDQEHAARKVLLEQAQVQLENRVWRAYGLLTTARVVSSEEALNLLSDLRLGIDLEIIKELTPRVMNELMIAIQPAYLQEQAGRAMAAWERDVWRANMIRAKLAADQF